MCSRHDRFQSCLGFHFAELRHAHGGKIGKCGRCATTYVCRVTSTLSARLAHPLRPLHDCGCFPMTPCSRDSRASDCGGRAPVEDVRKRQVGDHDVVGGERLAVRPRDLVDRSQLARYHRQHVCVAQHHALHTQRTLGSPQPLSARWRGSASRPARQRAPASLVIPCS